MVNKTTKATYRWNKEIKDVTFFVNHEGAKAEIIFPKRTELIIKAGATLRTEPVLKKDGKPTLDTEYGQMLRTKYQDKIDGHTTIDDIILKSVNEAGIFLYFGNVNSWLVLQDKSGLTISEYCIVE